MSNSHNGERSHSDDYAKYTDQRIQDVQLRSAEIGQGTLIKRALPSRHKRMIGAWCFLDHAGPVSFPQGEGLDIGPHPHIGLQTFTWMIEGTILHTDSLGTKQLIRPKQVNLMTAGHGISHTEVAPATETHMHTAQLWIALPDAQRHIAPKFEHYPTLPVVMQDQIEFTILVGEFLNTTSPVQVYTPLLGVDLIAQADSQTCIALNPKFEYALIALDGTACINGHGLNHDNMLVLECGISEISLQLTQGDRVLLIGGEPFEAQILLWWNFVGRTMDDMQQAREDWVNHAARFGEIHDYVGKRLEAPPLPEQMRASK